MGITDMTALLEGGGSPFYQGTSVLEVLCKISRQYEARETGISVRPYRKSQ